MVYKNTLLLKNTYWLDKVDICLSHESVIALEHSLDIPATLNDISRDSPEQPYIRICVHKNFQIHHVSQFGIDQRKNSLEQN